jgi:DNA-binding CsgD family transcriptional regulator
VDTFFLLTLAVSNGVLAVFWGLALLRENREWSAAPLAAAGLSIGFQVWLCWGPGHWIVTWLAAISAAAAWITVFWGARRTGSSAEPDADSPNPWGLSERELEIGRRLGQGLIGKEIAYELGVRPVTVKNHLYNMYRKTGSRGRVELLNRLRERGCL